MTLTTSFIGDLDDDKDIANNHNLSIVPCTFKFTSLIPQKNDSKNEK